MTMEGILYRMRTGCPWRDLPKKFGKWNTIYRRFLLWSRKGVTRQLFELMSKDNDSEWIFIDSSIVKAHQHSTGASRLSDEHIGKSVAGNTTKIHLAVDSFGLQLILILQVVKYMTAERLKIYSINCLKVNSSLRIEAMTAKYYETSSRKEVAFQLFRVNEIRV